MNITSR